ncbi:MAG: choice-of-anchor D domain-containing protein [bacterium]
MKKYLLIIILLFVCAFPALSQTSDWFTDISEVAGLTTAEGSRVFCADLNGDNYPDYLLTGIVAVRNTLRLFLNVPDPQNPGKRKYVEATAESDINVNSDPTKTQRWSDVVGLADFDNDGDLDLMTATYTHRISFFTDSTGIEQGNYSEVLLNDGNAHFTLVKNSGMHDIIAYQGKVTVSVGSQFLTFDYPQYFLNATGMSFLDYDFDGNIDVYISTWFVVYEGGNSQNELKMKDILLKGNGDGTFTQIFDPAINEIAEPMYGVNATDYNNDGWQDVVTSGYCRSGGSLFKNMKNGKFSDSYNETHYSGQAMAGDHGQALCQWEALPGDFDNDGDMDLLQVSVHGGCDAGEGRTHISVNNGPDSNYSYRWDLNLLKRNVPASYTHVGDMGGEWIDLDGNGFLDVVICQQGYESGDVNTSGQTRTYMLLQNAKHSFDEVTDKLGMMITANRSHSVEPCDFDLDGDPDIMLTRETRPTGAPAVMKSTLWENHNVPGSFWSSVKLNAAAGSNKASIGARITLYSNGMAQIRDLQSGLGHFGGFQPLIKNFGMGKCHAIDSIKVRFPNKDLKTVVIKNPPTNAFLVIGENGLENMLFPDQKQYSVIGFDRAKLDFDLVSFGTDKSMKFTVKNFGSAELQVTKISMIDNDKNVFAFTNAVPPFTLQANETKEIEVKFTPSERTEFISTISFESNAYNSKAGLFDLRGECFKAEPTIASNLDTLKMGTVLNDDFVEKSLEIRNYGELNLNITGADINSNDLTFFTILTDCSNMLIKSGEKRTITLKFTPQVTADRAVPAELVLHSNAYNAVNLTIPIKVRGEIRKAFAELVAPSESGALVFPDTEIGCTCEEPLLINSIGTKPLEITGYEVKFDKAGIFKIRDYNPPYIVKPGESIALPFTFTPDAEKGWSRSLSITTNDYIKPVITLSIQGKGIKGNAVKENILNSSITVFPQPAVENVLVALHFDEDVMTSADIKLYNLYGQEVKAILKPVSSTKELAFELDLSNLQSGFYNLVVKVAGETYGKPIIISK